MNDITVLILTKNEEKNIDKAVTSSFQIAKRVVIVDCGSTDRTVELATKNGAEVLTHEWMGHAKQFNWAIDAANIQTEWVFRLDADERISKELASEIKSVMKSDIASDIDGFEMRWRIYFMNKWIRHGGTHKPYFLRLFRYGRGRVEERLMDEHIVVNGKVVKLHNDLIHYDYKGIDAWLEKHIKYSNLEIKMYELGQNDNSRKVGQRQKRGFYYHLPLFLRAKIYYLYRYYIQFGFLDGREGRIFIYLQAYWFRFIVDAKLFERTKDK